MRSFACVHATTRHEQPAAQQARFDDFVSEFNNERPHEALAVKTPGESYSPSPRPYLGLPELTYPLHDRDALVTACGRICMHRKKISISYTLAGQLVGIKENDDRIWIVSFMHYDLGYIGQRLNGSAKSQAKLRFRLHR